ncbi:MAG: hypothetical protein ACP5EQ_05730 [Candidatus Cloacimonadia bacterium]
MYPAKRGFRKILLVIIFLILLPAPLLSAFLQIAPSAKLSSVAEIEGLSPEPASIFYNPALFTGNFSLSLTHYSLFSLGDISYNNLVASFAIGRFPITAGIQIFGNEKYQEQTFILGSNFEIMDNFVLGLDCRLLNLDVKTIESRMAFQLDGGIYASAQDWKFSVSFSNITFSMIDKDDLPQECRTSIIYKISPHIETGISAVKEIGYDFSFRLGVVYFPIEKLGIMSGVQTHPERFSAGIELQLSRFIIDYALKTHHYLELTHYLTITYRLF